MLLYLEKNGWIGRRKYDKYISHGNKGCEVLRIQINADLYGIPDPHRKRIQLGPVDPDPGKPK
jgi:hypothetical protein